MDADSLSAARIELRQRSGESVAVGPELVQKDMYLAKVGDLDQRIVKDGCPGDSSGQARTAALLPLPGRPR